MRIKTFVNKSDEKIKEWIKLNEKQIKVINIILNIDDNDLVNTIVYEIIGNGDKIFNK